MKINLWGWFEIISVMEMSFTLITSNSVMEVLRSGFILIAFILLVTIESKRT